MTISYEAGIKAAKTGNNINNSYPHNHEEFVAGYKSIKPNNHEDYALKSLAKLTCPNEYPDLKL